MRKIWKIRKEILRKLNWISNFEKFGQLTPSFCTLIAWYFAWTVSKNRSFLTSWWTRLIFIKKLTKFEILCVTECHDSAGFGAFEQNTRWLRPNCPGGVYPQKGSQWGLSWFCYEKGISTKVEGSSLSARSLWITTAEFRATSDTDKLRY